MLKQVIIYRNKLVARYWIIKYKKQLRNQINKIQ